jgi:hypothetical protein
MRPIFTIHAGEFLVGQDLEAMGKKVWIPSKDDGVDLLVTDKANTKATSGAVHAVNVRRNSLHVRTIFWV